TPSACSPTLVVSSSVGSCSSSPSPGSQNLGPPPTVTRPPVLKTSSQVTKSPPGSSCTPTWCSTGSPGSSCWPSHGGPSSGPSAGSPPGGGSKSCCCPSSGSQPSYSPQH